MKEGEPAEWRQQLHAWVERVWREFLRRPEVIGLAVGGSLGRGQERPGSDLELGILVEKQIPDLPYFNIIEGRGVEAIQLVASEVEAKIVQVNADPTACVAWPIQLWRCQVVHDPTGLFRRFVDVFNPALVRPATVFRQMTDCLETYQRTREQTQTALQSEQPATALAKVRDGFNALVCAAFWHHGRIPRSQNRTHQRLSALCAAHGEQDFLAAFEAVYGLPVDREWALRAADDCSEQRRKALNNWGSPCRDFFTYAVDPDLRTGDLQGITAVHRLYVPMIQGKDLDDPEWRRTNGALLTWLDLANADAKRVETLLGAANAAHRSFTGALAPSLDDPLA